MYSLRRLVPAIQRTTFTVGTILLVTVVLVDPVTVIASLVRADYSLTRMSLLSGNHSVKAVRCDMGGVHNGKVVLSVCILMTGSLLITAQKCESCDRVLLCL